MTNGMRNRLGTTSVCASPDGLAQIGERAVTEIVAGSQAVGIARLSQQLLCLGRIVNGRKSEER
jgi:hypothetical protein